MVSSRIHTGCKAIEAANAVRKALFDQIIQSAIGDWRLMPKPFGGKAFKHLIGPQSLVLLEQNFQSALANRRQAQLVFLHNNPHTRQHIVCTMRVIMAFKSILEGGHWGA